MKAVDITGEKFGKLTAIKRNGFDLSPSRKHVKWDCKCECGNNVNVRLNALKSGGTRSCGCLMIGNVKHGFSKTVEYETWSRIKARCMNKNHPDYYLYGARGIKVCDRWDAFENFLLDMGSRPENTSIDRIDVNGNYEPSNCRWADLKVQSRNKRTNRFYELNGLKMCMADWAKHLGISFATLDERLKKWSLEKSLTTFKEN
jgi:hypothetical protein